jgi:ribosomal protein S18 acetylase RimI-like enzyme
MEIISAKVVSQFQTIEKLAREIMPEHYGPYMTPENILFFINKFQTAKAIQEQIQQGYEYYLLNDSGTDAGYLGIQITEDILNLSKLYILKQFRGKGIGDKAMSFVNELAFRANVSGIELIVNKYNLETIKFYEKRGYMITESFVHNYDNAYSVEEYKMEK